MSKSSERPSGPKPPVGLPARTIEIPAGCVLTTEEIVKTINQLQKRKLEQNEGFDVQAEMEGGFTVRVAPGVLLEHDEIVRILNSANRAKGMLFAELLILFQDGEAVQCNTNMKEKWVKGHRVRMSGHRAPTEF